MSEDACLVPGRSDPSTTEAGAPARLRYRLLTGAGDRAFCERISQALDEGYVLYGNPVLATVDGQLLAAQAVILPEAT